VDGAVGHPDRELAPVAEFEDPTSIVHRRVMATADRDQVRQIGRTAVAPPPKMVDLALIEGDRTAGHATTGVHRTQRSSLRSTCQPSRPTEIQLAGSMEDHPVADHDRVHLTVEHQLLQDVKWDFDIERPG